MSGAEIKKATEQLIQRPIGILVLGIPAAVAWFAVAMILGAGRGTAAAGAVAYGLVFGGLSFLVSARRRRH